MTLFSKSLLNLHCMQPQAYEQPWNDLMTEMHSTLKVFVPSIISHMMCFNNTCLEHSTACKQQQCQSVQQTFRPPKSSRTTQLHMMQSEIVNFLEVLPNSGKG
jgi:hypothetical protein